MRGLRHNPAHEVRFADQDGTPLVSAQLANRGLRVIISEANHNRLVEAVGPNLTWSLDTSGRPHVTVKSRMTKRSVTAARFLLGLSPRGRVHYQDGDYLNLREGNVRAGLSPSSRAPKVAPEPKHDVNRQRDKDGTRWVGIKVDGAKKRVKIDWTAYEALVADYGVRPWFVSGVGKGRRVVFESACPGILVPIAGALAGGEGLAEVGMKDGDYLNLRSSNLVCRSQQAA